MRNAVILLMVTAMLTGCATLSTLATAGRSVCEREIEVRAALEMALVHAMSLTPSPAQEGAIRAIQLSNAALDYCALRKLP